jgi:hypothetical protein
MPFAAALAVILTAAVASAAAAYLVWRALDLDARPESECGSFDLPPDQAWISDAS